MIHLFYGSALAFGHAGLPPVDTISNLGITFDTYLTISTMLVNLLLVVSLKMYSSAVALQPQPPSFLVNRFIVSGVNYRNSLQAEVIIVIVIVNSRFLQRPQKRSRGNQLVHRRLSKTKSIGSGADPESQAGRKADRQWMLFGVKTGREVGRRGWIRIEFFREQYFQFGVRKLWRDSY